MLVVVVGVFLVVEFPLAVLFVIVIVQNSLHVEIIDADLGDMATIFINLLILLSYSANFFIYCAMSAQFRAALFDMFSRRGVDGYSSRTAGEAATSRVARRSTAASSALPAATSVLPTTRPIQLSLSTNDDDRRTGTRRPLNWKTSLTPS